MGRYRTVLLASAAVIAIVGPVAGTAAAQQAGPTVTHQVITSFDGTPIYSTLFLPPGADSANPAPVIMRSHGWAGEGEREPTGLVQTLLDDGYAVFTWDERGFGYSGGEVNVLKPELEGRDVSVLIDWIAGEVDEVAHEPGDPSDPRIGFTGQSYGGGIQLLAATLDERVDVLAPEITWNDLRYSLYGGDVLNLGWSEALYAVGVPTAAGDGLDPRNPAGPQAGGLAPELHRAQAEGLATGQLSERSQDYMARSSLAEYGRGPGRGVAVPTLLMQGSVDTLFDLTEAADNLRHVQDNGTPAKLVAFCGGHVACPSSYAAGDDREHLDRAILTWFGRHLRGDTSVDTGATVEYRTNEGPWRSTSDFPPRDAELITARGAGSVLGSPTPTTVDATTSVDALRAGAVPPTPLFTAQPSPPGDPHAVDVEVAVAEDRSLELVGIPTASVQVSGTGPATHLFLKLVDRESGEVVNLQETPIRVENLSGTPQQVDLRLSGIAYTLPRGHHLDLQVATTSVMHATARTPAQADLDVQVAVPVRRAGGGN